MSYGDTTQLSVSVTDGEGAEVSDAVISYDSSDKSVITVSSTGLVEAVGQGKSTVTVSAAFDGITVSKSYEVVTAIVLNPEYNFITYAFVDAGKVGSNLYAATDITNINSSVSAPYYVWEDSEITSEDGNAPSEPIIVLDDAKKGTARMIEYDAAGFKIIEAGILFGNGTDMTVESCMYKAASKLNLNHGQFTAKPANDEYTSAIGYIIYEDNGEYKVVYSK